MREVANTTLHRLSGRVIRPVILVRLDWPGGTVLAHDRLGELVFGGETYLGVGAFGDISVLEEGAGIAVREVTLTLSAPLGAQAAIVAARPQVRNRAAIVRLGAVTETEDALEGTPAPIFDGVMRACSFRMRRLGESGSVEHRISVTCQNWFWNVRARRTRRHDHPSLSPLLEQTLTWPEE